MIRSEIEGALGQHGWPRDAAGRVVLASGEAVANAIEHGSVPDSHVHVELLILDADAAVIVVRDEGRPGASCPQIIPAAPPPASQQRGRGLVIMTRLAEEIVFRAVGGGTEVTMRFARPSADSASAA